MEKKKVRLFSRFMEVNAKRTQNKQRRFNLGSGIRGGGKEQRGKRLLLIPLSSVLVDLFPHMYITLVDFFFLEARNKKKGKHGGNIKSSQELGLKTHLTLPHTFAAAGPHIWLQATQKQLGKGPLINPFIIVSK